MQGRGGHLDYPGRQTKLHSREWFASGIPRKMAERDLPKVTNNCWKHCGGFLLLQDLFKFCNWKALASISCFPVLSPCSWLPWSACLFGSKSLNFSVESHTPCFVLFFGHANRASSLPVQEHYFHFLNKWTHSSLEINLRSSAITFEQAIEQAKKHSFCSICQISSSQSGVLLVLKTFGRHHGTQSDRVGDPWSKVISGARG